jgi:molybdopterin biosynthesis enzyme
MLWTRRASKDILSIVRDIVVLGLPGFLVSRVVEFLEWREKIIKNLTFAGAIRYVNQFRLFLKMVNRHFKAEHPIIGGITPVIAGIMSKIVYPIRRNKRNLTLSLGEDFARNLPRIKEVLGDELFNNFMEQSRMVKGG